MPALRGAGEDRVAGELGDHRPGLRALELLEADEVDVALEDRLGGVAGADLARGRTRGCPCPVWLAPSTLKELTTTSVVAVRVAPFGFLGFLAATTCAVAEVPEVVAVPDVVAAAAEVAEGAEVAAVAVPAPKCGANASVAGAMRCAAPLSTARPVVTRRRSTWRAAAFWAEETYGSADTSSVGGAGSSTTVLDTRAAWAGVPRSVATVMAPPPTTPTRVAPATRSMMRRLRITR